MVRRILESVLSVAVIPWYRRSRRSSGQTLTATAAVSLLEIDTPA